VDNKDEIAYFIKSETDKVKQLFIFLHTITPSQVPQPYCNDS